MCFLSLGVVEVIHFKLNKTTMGKVKNQGRGWGPESALFPVLRALLVISIPDIPVKPGNPKECRLSGSTGSWELGVC